MAPLLENRHAQAHCWALGDALMADTFVNIGIAALVVLVALWVVLTCIVVGVGAAVLRRMLKNNFHPFV